jgi:REP element-mobilizing transposase RayT
MPRKPRFNLVGIPQHIIQRGNNREPCFYAEQDYQRYLDDLLRRPLEFDITNPHINLYKERR